MISNAKTPNQRSPAKASEGCAELSKKYSPRPPKATHRVTEALTRCNSIEGHPGWRQDVDLDGGHISYRQFCELIEAHWAYLENWRSEHGAHTASAHG